jgi:hypothetical protein
MLRRCFTAPSTCRRGYVAALSSPYRGRFLWRQEAPPLGSGWFVNRSVTAAACAIAAPLFLVLGAIAIGFGATQGGFARITSYPREGGGSLGLTIGASVTIVVAGFADSGTMTAAHGTVLKVIAVAFVFINLGSVCTHCLYHGAARCGC